MIKVEKNARSWDFGVPDIEILMILILSMINGANRGIKAVLHVVNKFGAGQNNVAHLCI